MNKSRCRQMQIQKDADSNGFRFKQMPIQTDAYQMQNKQNRVEPKHVVDAAILHITTQDLVGLVNVTSRLGGNTRRNIMDIITTQWCQQ
ncbi:hypothetical protein Tco_1512441 [Tanacetum coccineum]